MLLYIKYVSTGHFSCKINVHLAYLLWITSAISDSYWLFLPVQNKQCPSESGGPLCACLNAFSAAIFALPCTIVQLRLFPLFSPYVSFYTCWNSFPLGGRNSSVGSAWARCPQHRGFDPPLGTFSGRGDFSLGVNMGSNSIPPKALSDERINRGLVCAHMHFIAQTQKILTFIS